jgi:hypothetical protein
MGFRAPLTGWYVGTHTGGETRHLLPGDEFELDAGEPHAERYGEAGATYWVGRHG